MRWRAAVLLGAAACSKGSPPPAPVEVYVVDPDASPIAPAGERPPFPARAIADDLGKGTCWMIPSEHEDALRAFAERASAPPGRHVLVGPASRQGFSRTYVVAEAPAIGAPCVQSMTQAATETTFDLAPACAGKVAADALVLVTMGGKAMAPPGADVQGTKVTVETAGAPARN